MEHGDHLQLRTIPPKTLLFAGSLIKKNKFKARLLKGKWLSKTTSDRTPKVIIR